MPYYYTEDRSFLSRERNVGLEDESTMREAEPKIDQHWQTYEGWKAQGRQVTRGEKSKRVEGVRAFHILQTKTI